MDINIVKAEKEHIDGIVLLEEECFSVPRSREIVESEIENPLSHFLAAVTPAGEIAGYLGVKEICGEAYITNIAVSGRFRRQGIGEALLLKAIIGAKSRKCEFITLEVRSGNSAAIALYEKCGFVPAGLRKNFYRLPDEDAVIYTYYFSEETK